MGAPIQERKWRDDEAQPSCLSSFTCGLIIWPSSSPKVGSLSVPGSNADILGKNESKETESISPKPSENEYPFSPARKFQFNELKSATRNFRPDSIIGEGGFGHVFKGWIEEHGTAPAKPGTGLVVAVKILNPNGLQGHKEWLAAAYKHHNLRFIMPIDPYWRYATRSGAYAASGGSRKWKCNFCGYEKTGLVTRVKDHLGKVSGKDVSICQHLPGEVLASLEGWRRQRLGVDTGSDDVEC
ncbi:hypothetical protein L7F22_047677 [Adiantum nelumboides]|nr:hypothetical protein [Adiantum nelumboides]